METREHRLKRMTMRSWRRGMKEMDLILGRFADAKLSSLPDDRLDAYERLLEENDPSLYKWVSGVEPSPAAHRHMVAEIAGFHRIQH